MLRGAIALLLLASPAAARVWQVGPQAELKLPSNAARVAEAGDTVAIAPGEYFDCAVWNQDRLTITGAGDGVVLTDQTCQGKAIFVVNGTDVTISRITFSRARVGDGNGAGIRAQGGSLAVRDSRFVNNQAGILMAGNPAANLTVADSRFEANGACEAGRCTASLMVGGIASLRVERSVFTAARGGALVQSGAAHTEIRESRLEDGPDGHASALLEVMAPGSVVVVGNALQKGPGATGPAAIALRRGGNAAGELRFRGNTLRNDTGAAAVFVLDWTSGDPVLEANTIPAGDTAVSSQGVLRNRASSAAHGAVDSARDVAKWARRTARSVLAF